MEKFSLDERKFLVQIFQKIFGVDFWTEKSEKSCHWKTPLVITVTNKKIFFQ